MKIFNLKRTRNNGTRGPRFLYEVIDADGNVVATSEQAREFVAAVVRVHPGPQGVFYSAGNFTADYTLLGKGVDKTDRSLVGAALYGRPFKSILPRWIYADACEYLDALPADAPRDPDATPEPASSADADACGSPGPGELFCQREAGHAGQCKAQNVDASLGVEAWDRAIDPNDGTPDDDGRAWEESLKT